MVQRHARQRFNAGLEVVGQASVVGAGRLLELRRKLCASEFALDEFFFLWATRKLGHRGESGIGQRLEALQLGHLGAGVGQLLEAAQGLECCGRISGGGGCPTQGPLGIAAATPNAASYLLAVSLTGSGSGLMGGSGSSHGQRKFCCNCDSLLRSAATGELKPPPLGAMLSALQMLQVRGRGAMLSGVARVDAAQERLLQAMLLPSPIRSDSLQQLTPRQPPVVMVFSGVLRQEPTW
jgi:hypothetical protein